MAYTNDDLERMKRYFGIKIPKKESKPKHTEDSLIYIYKSFDDIFIAESEAGVIEEDNVSDLVTRCIYKFGVGTYISKISPKIAKLGDDWVANSLTDEEFSDFYMKLCNSEDIDKQKTLVTSHNGESFKVTNLVLEDWRVYKLK